MSKTIKNIILFILGFCMYISIEVCFRSILNHGGNGFSNPICGIMGAICFLVCDKINNRISWDIDLFLQGIIGSSVVTALELIVGILDRFLLKFGMWDYSTMPLNFMGVICVPFSIAWVGLTIVAIFVADAINYYGFHEEPCPHYHIWKYQFKFKERIDT